VCEVSGASVQISVIKKAPGDFQTRKLTTQQNLDFEGTLHTLNTVNNFNFHYSIVVNLYLNKC
jgi:hypothetical protein